MLQLEYLESACSGSITLLDLDGTPLYVNQEGILIGDDRVIQVRVRADNLGVVVHVVFAIAVEVAVRIMNLDYYVDAIEYAEIMFLLSSPIIQNFNRILYTVKAA
jgi:hypothetical protein